MSVFTVVLRAFGSLIFGALVFFSFLAFLITNEVRSHFLDASFYTDALAENDIYNRVYDELLVDPEFDEESQRLLGDFDIPNEDVVDLARRILPPQYLQSQTENSINGIIAFLRKDSDDPQAFIELGPPIGNIKGVVLGYVDGRIDQMEVISVSTPEELSRELEFFFRTIEGGEVPRQVPSLDAVPPPLRAQAYDDALDGLKQGFLFSNRAIANLEQEEDGIKAELIKGDIKSALKLGASAVAEPVIDDAIGELRLDLDPQDRLDLVAKAAEADGQTREEFLKDSDTLRDWVDFGITVGPIVSLVVMASATAVLALVHLPHWRFALLWSGLVVLITGAFFLAVGVVLKTQLADRLSFECGDLPISACQMAVDVYNSLGPIIGDGFLAPSIAVTAIGGVLLLLSILALVRAQSNPS